MEEIGRIETKKGIARVGVRYAVFALAVIAVQIGTAAILRVTAPEWLADHLILVNFLLIILSMDVIGFPLIYLLNRRLPAARPEEKSMGAGRFFLGILFCAGITGAGALIGSVCHMGVSFLCGTDANANNAVAQLMLDSKPFMRILTAGILAPIFEELIFRKVLVDHLAKYGKGLAVAASGIMFGLFHGNFSQCFFAAGLGFFFAYIYVQTGRIRYSIAYHMMINLTTSVVTVTILSKYMEAMGGVDTGELMEGSVETVMQMLPVTMLVVGWVMFLAILAIVGSVLLCVNLKKFRLKEEEGAVSFSKAFAAIFTNPGMWAFLAVCLVLFVQTYI